MKISKAVVHELVAELTANSSVFNMNTGLLAAKDALIASKDDKITLLRASYNRSNYSFCMPVDIRKFIAILVKWVLVVVMIGGGYFIYLVFQNPGFTQSFIPAILMVAAYFLFYLLMSLLFILFYLFIALLLLSPFLLFLYWLIRRYKRKRAERAALQESEHWRSQFPTQVPATPPQNEAIPLMQRRFKW